MTEIVGPRLSACWYRKPDAADDDGHGRAGVMLDVLEIERVLTRTLPLLSGRVICDNGRSVAGLTGCNSLACVRTIL